MQPEIMEFSDEERRVLEYFRPSAASKWRRGAIFDLSLVIISLGLVVVYLLRGDPGAGFVAYGLVFWRSCRAFWQGHRYAQVYRSIFTKYQARLQELERTSTTHPKT
jgi:hypothetical protein